MVAKWLVDEGVWDPRSPWETDAPWEKAVGHYRGTHEYLVRGTAGVMRYAVTLSSPSKDVLRQLFYGSPAEFPGEAMGLSRYFSTRNPALAQCAVNVLDGGCNGGSSAYLVGWDPRSCHMVSADGTSSCPEACVVVRDWRNVVRVANIGVRTADIVSLFMHAMLRIPRLRDPVRPKWYVNRSTHGMLKDYGFTLFFRDVPIRIVDELRDDEPFVA